MSGRGVCETHGAWELDGHDCPGCEIARLDARVGELEGDSARYAAAAGHAGRIIAERDALRARVRDMEQSWRVAEEQRLDLVRLAEQQEAREPRLREALRQARANLMAWNSMGADDRQADELNRLYEQSPEIKEIDAALAEPMR